MTRRKEGNTGKFVGVLKPGGDEKKAES